ncbi:peroxiredoxin [Anaerosolibacter carboniphilus]|uniref:Peroxiredoxin n=1 Tax=Anaerosolibacter carboniphilus TaxID=1417629 RepID=A0A841KYZ2_9FIRM|nr:TlpA disulfide reductase family protein [Anaerosolibacter carboniphilus]MBB6218701.1 peroxiredoxin [Anaerosolibacter carboniphilus]
MNRKGLIIVISIILIGILGSAIYFRWLNPKKEDPGKISIEEPMPGQEETPAPGEEQIKENGNTGAEENSGSGVFPGDKAYDFTLVDREGNEITLSSLKGKVVFINFWTTWCGYCVTEMPHMQEVYETYKDKKVVVLAVNVLAAEKPGTEMTNVNDFVDEKGFTFPVLFDVDGAVSVKYRVRAFPTTYILDQEGTIVEVVTGAMDKDTMMEKIEHALNQ